VFAVVLDAVDTHSGADDRHSVAVDTAGIRPAAANGGHGRRRVVHVSGDPATRTTVEAALRSQLEADTISVPRAALALDAVRRVRPAFVLIDRNLPDAAATDLLRQLVGDPLVGTIPVVVLSTADEPRERLRLRQAGAAEVLTSPWDVRTIAAAASQLV
jgi:DNA-binding response OmpR family regulator